MQGRIKKNFITGIVAILPITLTVFVVYFLIVKTGGLIGGVFKKITVLPPLPEFFYTFLGFISVIVLIYIIGVLTSSFLGRYIMRMFERFMERLPFVRGIYSAARKLTDTIFMDRSAFKRVVLVEYPRKGTYAMGFLTTQDTWEHKGKKLYNVFIPTTPNPTSGYYLLVPEDELVITDIPIEEGLKIIVSSGIILPEKRRINEVVEEKKD